MDRTQVPRQLVSVYRAWKKRFDPRGLTLNDFSPPLLLKITEDYCRAPMKVAVYGKETMGWSWGADLQDNKYKYPKAWPFQEQRTLGDFLRKDDAIKGLCWGYEQFDFAKSQPKNYSSPFWRAFREVQKWRGAGVMWTNLVRVDYHCRSILDAANDLVQTIVRQQAALVRDELKILTPNVCIFFTGPTYDSILESTFPYLHWHQLDMTPTQELARLSHKALPKNSYRTYHPAYLNRRKKWKYLDLIRKDVLSRHD